MIRLLALAALALAAACNTTPPNQPELAFGDLNRPSSTPDPRDMKSKPPPMDPRRAVSRQDCRRQIEMDGRNLRCV